jgi:hypothetical protein
MAKTVDDLRNEIRASAGRFEREISATFTKEDLAAICDSVGYDIDRDPLPPKPQMRAGILSEISPPNEGETSSVERAFRKAELESISEFFDE